MDKKTTTFRTMQDHQGAELTVSMLANSLSVLLEGRIRKDLNIAIGILQEVRFFSVWLHQRPEEAGEAVKRLVEYLTEGEMKLNPTPIITETTNHEQL